MLHVFRPCLIGRLAWTSKMLRFHVQSRKNVGVVSTLFQAPQVGACNYFPALHARKRNSEPEPLLKPTIIKEVSEDDEDDDNVILDDFKEDEASMNYEGDDYYEEDSVELYAGDGGGGGGISLAGVWWDNKALEIAEEVILSFDGDPKIYAFKTLPNFTIQVRIEKLLNRSGPQIWKTLKLFQEPIEHDLMKQKSVPENLSLEEMGRCWFSGVLIGLGCVWWVVVGVVEGYPAEDLVVRLPGQPNVGFKQYAGYVDVDVKAGRSLFYYFVEADKEPDKKPLTLWLNGGPGCSSIGGGAFTELGPFYPTGDGRGLRRNLMSWNRASNLLFVESPAGVGWSYSNTSSDYNSGDASAARDMHTFLLKWYEKFPAFRSRELFLTGESYAGHYIPQLAIAILDHNEHSTGFKFNLKGIAIGNPLLRLDRDIPATYEYFWSHGMISDEIGLTIMNECDFDDYVFPNPHNVTVKCNTAVSQANQIVGEYINNYDVILDVCYPSIVQQELRLRKTATKISVGVDVCMSSERRFYLNLPEVQKALHANRTNLPYSWSMCSNVLNYSDTDANINILPLLARIVHNRIPVWVFSGDQDSVVPLLGSRTLIRELAHDLKFQITVPYGVWFHKGQVGGWATEYGDLLTFATVRGAAHMVPYAQPSRALHLFSSFIRGRRLPNTTHPSIYD